MLYIKPLRKYSRIIANLKQLLHRVIITVIGVLSNFTVLSLVYVCSRKIVSNCQCHLFKQKI